MNGHSGKKKQPRLLLCLAAAATVLAVLAAAFASCSTTEPLSETRFMLDTVCTIRLCKWDGDGESLLDGAFGLCSQYDRLLSTTVSGSDVYRINHGEGRPVTVSDETAALLERSKEYCRLSEGEFDITVYPVKALWDFSGESSSLPDAEQLAEAVKKSGLHQDCH